MEPRTKPVRLLHRAIPILTWLEYAQKPSGFFQIDLVRHDGGNPSGEVYYTLTMTDVKTIWPSISPFFAAPVSRRTAIRLHRIAWEILGS
jgi:hypothetical protein